MARDHTRINLDIWGDDEFRDLPVDAQNLYWTLWTSPDRTYCGAHDWRPGKLTQCAGDWTVDRIVAAGAVLSERLFLLIDEVTEECLIRSWIKHDGLWRIPNMAVTLANARSAVGSKTLRGVIVHEVKKLVKAEPDLGSWKRDEVAKMLSQRAIDPASVEPFTPPPTPPASPPPTRGLTPDLTLNDEVGVNPTPNPAPTTATATSTTATSTKEGYVSQVSHQSLAQIPSPYCPKHPSGINRPCPACADARRAHDAATEAEYRRVKAERRDALARRQDCTECDSAGWRLDSPDDAAVKCTHGGSPTLQLVHSDANQGRAVG
ncbi:hypothetical protein [Mycobacteroides abscessus]|uniref:hypothetical protein n=1 Tax=Mycobacteroides abscessus TaxID=36809 RepID=UPI00092BA459|nr:hypothetical protein [Mycobacteroides abscessus]QSM04880.1 RepA-like replication initiator [Mycobacterium phage prophi91-4]MDO3335129.1 hypothetical protein [Mycobacteroides abscessus subsp. bolletii]QSM87832.1 hypothetical protein I3U44_18730 [Mycobacteroides abscessus subsp. bolletii]SIB01049.1 Uncharacterised protein [Mycobacteroides abscessus subsp. bolletii]SII70012.1 Uncharacterised protein [Mycobacteroides abscessus subsp. bolletii]